MLGRRLRRNSRFQQVYIHLSIPRPSNLLFLVRHNNNQDYKKTQKIHRNIECRCHRCLRSNQSLSVPGAVVRGSVPYSLRSKHDHRMNRLNQLRQDGCYMGLDICYKMFGRSDPGNSPVDIVFVLLRLCCSQNNRPGLRCKWFWCGRCWTCRCRGNMLCMCRMCWCGRMQMSMQNLPYNFLQRIGLKLCLQSILGFPMR